MGRLSRPNQKGFIEIEYLISAAIGIVVMAAFAGVITHMSNMQRMNDIAQDSSVLVEDLNNALKAPDFCTSSLGPFTMPTAGNTANISFAYDLGGSTVTLEAGQEVQPGLRITKMQLLQNPALPGTTLDTAAGTYTQISAIMRVGTEKVLNGSAISLRDRDIPLTLTLDSANHVVYCNNDSLAAQACYQSGGKYNPTANLAAGETHCMPTNHCDYGGTFSNDPSSGFDNPFTHTRGCPNGYTPERTGTVSKIITKAKYTDGIKNSYYGISTCMRCGTTLVAQGGGVQDSIVDSSSFAQTNATIDGMSGYYDANGMYHHITTTGQQAGAYVAPTPVPVQPTPPPPTPVPTAAVATPPPTSTCDGATPYVPPVTIPSYGCPSNTTAVSIPYGGLICSCNNYNPATPTPTPSGVPTDCAGYQAAYLAANGGGSGNCGGTLTCIGAGDVVRENCGGAEWYTWTYSTGNLDYHEDPCGHCFVAGSRVTMADGSAKAIETLRVGDQVLSYDETTGEEIATSVVKPITHAPRYHQMYDLELENGRLIQVTKAHPIYVVEQRGYVNSGDIAALFALGVHQHLLDQSGRAVAIKSVRPYKQRLPTYNLSVDGAIDSTRGPESGVGHNYFIEGALVHNKAVCP